MENNQPTKPVSIKETQSAPDKENRVNQGKKQRIKIVRRRQLPNTTRNLFLLVIIICVYRYITVLIDAKNSPSNYYANPLAGADGVLCLFLAIILTSVIIGPVDVILPSGKKLPRITMLGAIFFLSVLFAIAIIIAQNIITN